MMEPTIKTDKYELWLGDCLDVLPHLEPVDLLLTDPPYGGGYAANPIVGKNKTKSNHDGKAWDDNPVSSLDAILRKSVHSVVWGGNYYPLPPSRGWLIWHKPDAPPSMASAELAWTSRDMNTRMITHSIAATNKERVGHPTQKPLRVIEWCLTFFPDIYTVLDPYFGSGTTGVACIKNNCYFIGIEKEEKYFDIAARRLEECASQQMFDFSEAIR